MFEKIINFWIRKKTKNLTRIPLFTMTFDYQRYKHFGKKDSCIFYVHPEIGEDAFVRENIQKVVDHIRDNYELDIFTRI